VLRNAAACKATHSALGYRPLVALGSTELKFTGPSDVNSLIRHLTKTLASHKSKRRPILRGPATEQAINNPERRAKL
jgi:hypothetical protein